MKTHNQVFHGFIAVMIILIFSSFSSTVYAKNKDCWVDLFSKDHYKGDHLRIMGPKQYKNLHKINGEDWDKRIESVLVGPKATLVLFENKNFKLTLKEIAKHPVLMKSMGITTKDVLEDSELIFKAGSKIHSFGGFGFYHKVRSLKVECVRKKY